jgi:uncharacterized protein YukE
MASPDPIVQAALNSAFRQLEELESALNPIKPWLGEQTWKGGASTQFFEEYERMRRHMIEEIADLRRSLVKAQGGLGPVQR